MEIWKQMLVGVFFWTQAHFLNSRPIGLLLPAQMHANKSSFLQYKFYADISEDIVKNGNLQQSLISLLL